jgi:hypothetical protein
VNGTNCNHDHSNWLPSQHGHAAAMRTPQPRSIATGDREPAPYVTALSLFLRVGVALDWAKSTILLRERYGLPVH